MYSVEYVCVLEIYVRIYVRTQNAYTKREGWLVRSVTVIYLYIIIYIYYINIYWQPRPPIGGLLPVCGWRLQAPVIEFATVQIGGGGKILYIGLKLAYTKCIEKSTIWVSILKPPWPHW